MSQGGLIRFATNGPHRSDILMKDEQGAISSRPRAMEQQWSDIDDESTKTTVNTTHTYAPHGESATAY